MTTESDAILDEVIATLQERVEKMEEQLDALCGHVSDKMWDGMCREHMGIEQAIRIIAELKRRAAK